MSALRQVDPDLRRRPRVVIVEDEFLQAEDLRDRCERMGCIVLNVARRSTDALQSILAGKPDHVLMDVDLGGGPDGIEVARLVAARLPETRFVFITATADLQGRGMLPRHAFLRKPVSSAWLRIALDCE